MRVSDVMTRDVRAVAPARSIREAARLMDELNVGVLPVCESGQLVGLVTDRDITVRATAAGLLPDATTVMSVMTAQPRCVFADQDVSEAVEVMTELQVRRIPVLDRDGKLAGIVALGDLAEDRAPGAAEALAGISSPSEPDRTAPAQAGRPGARGDRDPLTPEEHAELARRQSVTRQGGAAQGRLDDLSAAGLGAGRRRRGVLDERDEDLVRAAFGTAGEEPGAGGPAAAGGGSAGDAREGAEGVGTPFFHDDPGTPSAEAAGYGAEESEDLGIRTVAVKARHIEPARDPSENSGGGLQPPRPARQPDDR